MVALKELSRKEDFFVSGHKLCAGCGIPVILKLVLRASKYPIVVANASGCLAAGSAYFPQNSWKINWIHGGSGNASAVISGIETMYKSLKKQGKLADHKEINFLAIGGDGATYDRGLGSLSGAIERGHDFVYLCLDNQANACSGGQRSSASPMGAATRTTPAGSVLPGKMQLEKKLSRIVAAHKVAYTAQASPWNWQDLYKKAQKAFEVEGPAFLNVLTPCPTVWKFPTEKSVQLTKVAADTCLWPIYEVFGDRTTINYRPPKRVSVTQWFELQGRFKHLLKAENKWILEEIQDEIDKDWEWLISQENKGKLN
jgi:pyruvate ferredoxin oxidoreductase beta subunit